MAISIGQTAPSFSLFDTEKNKVSLSNYLDKNVLLLFFPLAYTGTCTAELCSVRDNIATYNNANAVVLGISVDSIFTLAKYKDDQQLNFSLLSDFNKEASTAYQTIYETFGFDMKGVGKRSAFVVDKQGVIQYAEVLENASELPNFEAIQQVLSSLQ